MSLFPQTRSFTVACYNDYCCYRTLLVKVPAPPLNGAPRVYIVGSRRLSTKLRADEGLITIRFGSDRVPFDGPRSVQMYIRGGVKKAKESISMLASVCHNGYVDQRHSLVVVNGCTNVYIHDLHWKVAARIGGWWPGGAWACPESWTCPSCCALRRLPTPTAIAPTAWATPEARTVPPLRAGIAGNVPAVMRTALIVDIALGCSAVRKLSAWHAFSSQVGTLLTVVTAKGSRVYQTTIRSSRVALTNLGYLAQAAP